MSFWIQVCHLLCYNQYDNSFVLGSVCRLKVVFKLQHSQVILLATLKGACCHTAFVGEPWQQTQNSSFIWYEKSVKKTLGQTNSQPVLGKRAADLNQLLLLGAALETPISLSLKAVLMWTSLWAMWISKWARVLADGLPFPIRTYFRNFAAAVFQRFGTVEKKYFMFLFTEAKFPLWECQAIATQRALWGALWPAACQCCEEVSSSLPPRAPKSPSFPDRAEMSFHKIWGGIVLQQKQTQKNWIQE